MPVTVTMVLPVFSEPYFYFEKVKRYGDIPWYDKALDSDDPELYKARDSREFVMQKNAGGPGFCDSQSSENEECVCTDPVDGIGTEIPCLPV